MDGIYANLLHNSKIRLPQAPKIPKISRNFDFTSDVSVHVKQILVRKTFKRKFTMAYQKLNLKQDIRTIKSPSTTKSTKMTRNYRMNSGKSKLQKKSQS